MREGGEMRKLKSGLGKLVHSLECKYDSKYGTFIGTLVKDKYLLQSNHAVCRVLGINYILKKLGGC